MLANENSRGLLEPAKYAAPIMRNNSAGVHSVFGLAKNSVAAERLQKSIIKNNVFSDCRQKTMADYIGKKTESLFYAPPVISGVKTNARQIIISNIKRINFWASVA